MQLYRTIVLYFLYNDTCSIASYRTIVRYNCINGSQLHLHLQCSTTCFRRTMNKQYKSAERRGIEWTDFTWNPVGGCQHGCRWEMPDGTIAECYAETVAERVAQSTYIHGFEHHYWNPQLLAEPLKVKKPSKIFMDIISDLMGHWGPDEQVNQVLD